MTFDTVDGREVAYHEGKQYHVHRDGDGRPFILTVTSLWGHVEKLYLEES